MILLELTKNGKAVIDISYNSETFVIKQRSELYALNKICLDHSSQDQTPFDTLLSQFLL